MNKILVPVDGSKEANAAAAWALKAAAAFGASVTLLHVYDILPEDAMGLADLSSDAILASIEHQAAPSFDSAKAVMGDHEIEIDTISVIGRTADEIINVALTNGFNHIVMGRRGLSQLRGLLLGSVSEKVTRRAHCAVTVLN